MRIYSYIAGFVFVLFALVQLNDPDFLIWFLIYMLVAAVSFVYTHRRPNRILLAVLAVASLVGAIALFPLNPQNWIEAEEKSKSLGMNLPGIEEARESMGLLLCFLVLGFYWLKARIK